MTSAVIRRIAPIEPEPRAPRDTTLWRSDRYLAPIADRLSQLTVLSLDVFDTLLFRLTRRPEDVFLEVGRRAEARGLLGQRFTAGEFAALRADAQTRLYATLGREPTLEDIYAALPDALSSTTALLTLEVETEADLLVLNPSVASLVAHCHAARIPVVLLSDMYLGERRIRQMLAQAGFDTRELVDHVLVSVDQGAYKMTGALFAKLLALFPGVSPSSIVHIGDNLRSDVRAAAAAGLTPCHYGVVTDDPDATLEFESLACGHMLPDLVYLRRLAGSLTADRPSAEHAWFRTGAQVVGPFMAALVDWALDQCVDAGATLLLPLMREGHVLAPMAQRAADARGLDVAVAPLSVSRQAVAVAGIEDVAADVMARLFDGRRHFTIADFFALLGTALPAEIATHASSLTSSADAIAVSPGTSLRAWISAYAAGEGLRPRLERLVAAERRRLVDYVHGVTTSHRRVATLDIGFFGQIQRSLSTALARVESPLQPTHLFGFGHGPVQADVTRGRDVRVFAGGYGTNGDLVKTIHRSAPVIEQLLQGPEGSTTGYADIGTGVVPVRETNPLSEEELKAKAAVQAGIHAFHALWLDLRRHRPHVVDRLVSHRHAWCQLLHRLIDSPTAVEAARLGSLHDDVNFGSQAVLPFCPTWAEPHVSRLGARATIERGTHGLPVVWPQGVIARVDPGAMLDRFAVGSSTPYLSLAVKLARDVRRSGVTRVIGYGTGEVAVAFALAARMTGLEVAAFVDSHPAAHGTAVAGIDVVGLDRAVDLALPYYVVLSVAHAAAIVNTIRARYASETTVPVLFDVSTLLSR